jgi:hypothetical protein
MTAKAFLGAILLAILAAQGSYARAENILQNPGFESGQMAPWFEDQVFDGNEAWHVTSADAHSGLFGATAVGDRSIRQNFEPIPAIYISQIGFWLRQPSVGPPIADSGGIAVRFHFPQGPITFFQNTTNTWKFYDVTEFLPQNETLIGISIFGYGDTFGGENRTYLDDLTINAIPEPAIFLPVTSLLIILGRRVRRTSPDTSKTRRSWLQ